RRAAAVGKLRREQGNYAPGAPRRAGRDAPEMGTEARVVARYLPPEVSPWKPRGLTIPPDSTRAWIRLAVWECLMGALVCSALIFGTRLIRSAPDNIITVFDLTKCYAAPPVAQPCERVAYKA